MAWALGFSVEELDMRKSMFIRWKGLVPVSSIWRLVTVGLTVQGLLYMQSSVCGIPILPSPIELLFQKCPV